MNRAKSLMAVFRVQCATRLKLLEGHLNSNLLPQRPQAKKRIVINPTTQPLPLFAKVETEGF